MTVLHYNWLHNLVSFQMRSKSNWDTQNTPDPKMLFKEENKYTL